MGVHNRTIRRIIIGAVLPVGLALAVGACSSSARGEAESTNDTYTMRWALTTGDSYPSTIAAMRAAAAITKDTDGKIKASVYANGVLGEEGTAETDLLSGATVQATVTVKMDDRCAETGLLELPYMFQNLNQAFAGVDGSAAQQIYANCAAKGYAIPAVWDSGFRDILSKNPIKSLSDLQGLKLRVAACTIFDSAYEALGVKPSDLDKDQVYTALQQGVVDGVEFPVSDIYDSDFQEVDKNLAVINTLYGADFVVVSEKWLQTLPTNLRAIVINDIKAQTTSERQLNAQQTNQDLKLMQQKYGVSVVYPNLSPFRAALQSFDKAEAKKLGISLYNGILADAKSAN